MSIFGPGNRPTPEPDVPAPIRRSAAMKVIVFVKATANSEAGAMPTRKLIEDMTAYNEELVKAGIMQGGDGLKPSRFGKRVTFRTSGKKSVTDGPFAETK